MYALACPNGPIPGDVLERAREWLRHNLPVPHIEHPADVWHLFETETSRQIGLDRIRKNPKATFSSKAAIWVRPVYIELISVCSSDTDKALHEFAAWATTHTPLKLDFDGTPFPPEGLIHPDRYLY